MLVEVLESVSASLAVNEEVVEDQDFFTLLKFEGNSSAVLIERVGPFFPVIEHM